MPGIATCRERNLIKVFMRIIATTMMNGNSAPSFKKGSVKYTGWLASKNGTVTWREPLLPREKDPKTESPCLIDVTVRKHSSICSASKSPTVSLFQRCVWVRALVKTGLKTSNTLTFYTTQDHSFQGLQKRGKSARSTGGRACGEGYGCCSPALAASVLRSNVELPAAAPVRSIRVI